MFDQDRVAGIQAGALPGRGGDNCDAVDDSPDQWVQSVAYLPLSCLVKIFLNDNVLYHRNMSGIAYRLSERIAAVAVWF